MCYFSRNCAASVSLSTFMCLWAIYIFLGSVLIFGCRKIDRPILEIYHFFQRLYECRNWETEHYHSALEIRRLHSFISGNTWMGTRHLYWILNGPSFAVHYHWVKKLQLLTIRGKGNTHLSIWLTFSCDLHPVYSALKFGPTSHTKTYPLLGLTGTVLSFLFLHHIPVVVLKYMV